MAKICEILAKKNVSGDLGIEIECEGKNLPLADPLKWTQVHDGSLRGNFPNSCSEYVLPTPLGFAKAMERVEYLIQAGQQNNTTWNFSFRTSMHVHLNVLSMEEKALQALVYLYSLVEPVLHSYCGKERRHNRFCLRIQDAEDTIQPMVYLVTKGVYDFSRTFAADNIRYAALNLASLAKYGSIEFRGMRGTLDLGVVRNWCGAILRLRTYAEMCGSIEEVYRRFLDTPADEWFDSVLEEYANTFKYKGYEDDLRMSYSLTLEIPTAYKITMDRQKRIEEEEKLFAVPKNKIVPAPNRFVPRGIGAVPAAPPRRRVVAVDPEAVVNPFDFMR